VRLHELDVAHHFTPANFEAKIKQMNGYQAHIVSPELAVRAVIADAFTDAAPLAAWLVLEVRTFVAKAARDAAAAVVETDPQHREDLAEMIVHVRPTLNDIHCGIGALIVH
jgi:hypothetical protein